MISKVKSCILVLHKHFVFMQCWCQMLYKTKIPHFWIVLVHKHLYLNYENVHSVEKLYIVLDKSAICFEWWTEKSYLVVTNCNSVYHDCILNHKDNNQASYCISHPFTHVHLKSLVWVPLYCILFSLDPNPQSNQAVIPPCSNQIFATCFNILPIHILICDMQSLI